jgi:hypothetical protein
MPQLDMPLFPDTPFHEGDIVEVIQHAETIENTSYAHLIGERAIVINPAAGSQAHGRAASLIAVRFEDGEVEAMFHWRFKLVRRDATWEV